MDKRDEIHNVQIANDIIDALKIARDIAQEDSESQQLWPSNTSFEKSREVLGAVFKINKAKPKKIDVDEDGCVYVAFFDKDTGLIGTIEIYNHKDDDPAVIFAIIPQNAKVGMIIKPSKGNIEVDVSNFLKKFEEKADEIDRLENA